MLIPSRHTPLSVTFLFQVCCPSPAAGCPLPPPPAPLPPRSYCGCHNASSVVKCLASGKWFCNGQVHSQGACIVLHLVRGLRSLGTQPMIIRNNKRHKSQ